MSPTELVLLLLVAIAALATVARRANIPYPIAMVLGGLALGFIPGIPRFELAPELVFLVFLPPLLYYAGFFTSVRDFKANTRPIALLAVGLVLFTVGVVAIVARTLVPTLPWPAAFALGAIVAPPDALAASAIFRRLGAPRRVVTILEGESLLNDATALVAYRFALVALATGAFSVGEAVFRFVVVGGGGVLVGLAVAFGVAWLRSRLSDTPVNITVSLLTPFATYLPAERLGASGVLAAVSAGLYLGRKAPRLMSSETRLTGAAVWQMGVFILNGLAFILIGLQLPLVLERLEGRSAATLAWLAVAVSLAVIVARFVWVVPATYLPRLLSARLRARDPYPPWRAVFVVAWAGMRGVVSLAAALALPHEVPERDLLILLTFAVILATLVGQGLSLPFLIRWLGVGEDGDPAHDEAHARAGTAEAAVARLDELAVEWPTHMELIDQLRGIYQHRTRHADAHRHGTSGAAEQELLEHRQIRHAVIEAERQAAIEMRDRGIISDEVLRAIERDLDLEELRMEA
jgi:monovalent cation/hydrogen antiporter